MNPLFLPLIYNLLRNCDHACDDFGDCNVIKVVSRDKNLSFLYQNGMIIQDVCEILKSLTESDYLKGPEPDHQNKDDQIYVYRKVYEKLEIYIKLKCKTISNDSNNEKEKIIIISFHESTPLSE